MSVDLPTFNKCNVGLELELEVVPILLTNLALFGEGGSAPVVREETSVALSTEPAFGRQPAIAGAL